MWGNASPPAQCVPPFLCRWNPFGQRDSYRHQHWLDHTSLCHSDASIQKRTCGFHWPARVFRYGVQRVPVSLLLTPQMLSCEHFLQSFFFLRIFCDVKKTVCKFINNKNCDCMPFSLYTLCLRVNGGVRGYWHKKSAQVLCMLSWYQRGHCFMFERDRHDGSKSARSPNWFGAKREAKKD